MFIYLFVDWLIDLLICWFIDLLIYLSLLLFLYFKEHSQKCEYRIIDCPNADCDLKILKMQEPIHETECEYRSVNCDHCAVQHAFKYTAVSTVKTTFISNKLRFTIKIDRVTTSSSENCAANQEREVPFWRLRKVCRPVRITKTVIFLSWFPSVLGTLCYKVPKTLGQIPDKSFVFKHGAV